jgi:DNA-binding phage protein
MIDAKDQLVKIGEQIKKAISKSKTPIEHIAADLHMSKQTIYNIIDGDLNYTIVNLLNVLNRLGLKLSIKKGSIFKLKKRRKKSE